MKKYHAFLFALILLLMGFVSKPYNTFPLIGKLIVIDPGHGDADPGAIYNNEYEKDYNLDFAYYVTQSLESYGATVLMTRYNDSDLSSSDKRRKRTDFNNRIIAIDDRKADMYLSLHMNYLNDSSYYGSQVFYSSANKANQKIAMIIQKELNTFFKFDKPIKEIGKDKYLYSKLKSKGVLIEYGFLSNSKDRVNLKQLTYKENLADAISIGIINYFS